MKRLNIEIKAICNDHEKIRAILESRNADFRAPTIRLIRMSLVARVIVYHNENNPYPHKQ